MSLPHTNEDLGYSPGVLLGPISRSWSEADALDWLSSRPFKEDLEGGK